MRSGGIKIFPRGETRNGDRSGPGFYVADRIEGWSNLDPAYRPMVLVHDGAMRVIDNRWLAAHRDWPTAEEAQRLGIDGYDGHDELVLYNSQHVRVLSEREARPHVIRALRAFRGGLRNAGGIARIAREYLSPAEAADVVRKAYVKNLANYSDLFEQWADNPSRRALHHMLRVGLAPENAGHLSDLQSALRVRRNHPGFSPQERELNRNIQAIVADVPSPVVDEPTFARYRASLPNVYARLAQVLPGGVPNKLQRKLSVKR